MMLLGALGDAVEKASAVLSAEIRQIARDRICEGYLPDEIKRSLALLEEELRRRDDAEERERRLLEICIARIARTATDELFHTYQQLALAHAAARRRRQLDLLSP
jgi:hypothetical protein